MASSKAPSGGAAIRHRSLGRGAAREVALHAGHASALALSKPLATSCGPARSTGASKDLELGFLLTDLSFTPLYTTDAAIQLLNDSRRTRSSDGALIQHRIRSILHAERFTSTQATADFASHGRQYTCRAFLLESQERDVRTQMVAILLEQPGRDVFDWSDLSRRFHLSRREVETIQYLVEGLTTKELAQRMSISPNTVKQFIRFIMTKMTVTTRAGILGKLMMTSGSTQKSAD